MTEFIHKTATDLRTAIEKAAQAKANIAWLSRYPKKCCNFAANLLLLDLADGSVNKIRRMIGGVGDPEQAGSQTHVWLVADGITVDITADQFDQPRIIVEEKSPWHESLHDVKPFIQRADVPEGLAATEISRLGQLYEQDRKELAAFRG